MSYIVNIVRLNDEKVINYSMNKSAFISFRTTENNIEFLKEIAAMDDRSVSYVIDKMVNNFRLSGTVKETIKKLHS